MINALPGMIFRENKNKMYGIKYSQGRNYSSENYNKFIKQSLERLTAHFGDYSGGGYNLKPKPIKLNIDYEL